MDDQQLKNIIEALLMSANEPLTLDHMLTAFDEWQRPELGQLRLALVALADDYQHRAIELIETARGFSVQTKQSFSEWIGRLQAEKPAKYSRALLETLAIIAYKQPVTRADIEEVRGVAVNSAVLKTLMEREWIKIAGRRDVPGKPAVYVTTKNFLDYFNLSSLDQLPPIDMNTLPMAMTEELITE